MKRTAFNANATNASSILQMHEKGIRPGDSIELILYQDCEFYEIPAPEQRKGIRGPRVSTNRVGGKCAGILDHYEIVYPKPGTETAEKPLVDARSYHRVFITEVWDSERKESKTPRLTYFVSDEAIASFRKIDDR